MDGDSGPPAAMAGAVKRFLYRLLAMGENRFLLLVTEIQEERDRLLDKFLLAMAASALALLGAIAWSAAVVLLFWQSSPVGALLILGALYAIGAILLCRRLIHLRRHQQALAGTLDQLQKDRACLK